MSNEELAQLFVSDAEYYSDRTCVTNSMLGELKKGPASLMSYLNGDAREYVKAFAVGNLIHTQVLEPEKVDGKFFVYDLADRPDPTKTLRYGANKDWELAQIELGQSQGLIPVEQSDMEMTKRIHDKLWSIPEIKDIIESADKEVAKVWDDFEFGIRCKGKADMIVGDTLVDLKTTSKYDIDGFRSSFYSFDYRRQAAYYADGFGVKNFMFIFVSKEEPHNVGIIECTQDTLARGRNDYKNLLEQYHSMFVSKEIEIDKFVPRITI